MFLEVGFVGGVSTLRKHTSNSFPPDQYSAAPPTLPAGQGGRRMESHEWRATGPFLREGGGAAMNGRRMHGFASMPHPFRTAGRGLPALPAAEKDE